jgi:Single Cache domain 2
MLRRMMNAAIFAASLAFSVAAYAQKAEYGTADDARAMLERVVAAIKVDPATTIAQINKGEGGFRDRDIYPSCAGPDGKNVAHPDPSRIGLIQKDNKDVTGKAYGAEFAKAEEGKFLEVSYMFPRPGADKTPIQKIAFATKVAGHICIVGYYK